jgi:hypothetical protein
LQFRKGEGYGLHIVDEPDRQTAACIGDVHLADAPRDIGQSDLTILDRPSCSDGYFPAMFQSTVSQRYSLSPARKFARLAV